MDPAEGERLAAAAAATSGPFRLGVVCMTKRPLCFATWLEYHLCLGVERFYVRVEDTPALASLLEQSRWQNAVRASFHTGTARDWAKQSSRQHEHVVQAIHWARADGLTHLLHIDDDELLCCLYGFEAMRASIECAPADVVNLHLRNLEALVPSAECANPFAEARAFRHRPHEYGAYGRPPSSGKSIGDLRRPMLQPNGPHFFGLRGESHKGELGDAPSYVLPAAAAVILHYESVSYQRWRDKFTEFARYDGGGKAQQFSSFNRASILACTQMLQARAARESAAAHSLLDHFSSDDAEESARQVWTQWRCEPPGLPHPPAQGALVLRDHGITLMQPPAASMGASEEAANELLSLYVRPPQSLLWRVMQVGMASRVESGVCAP